MAPRKRDTVRQADREPFNKTHVYYAYKAIIPGGGHRILIADRDCRFGGQKDVYEIMAYEISKGCVVDQTIRRAELMDFIYLGSITGYGANIYCREGGSLKDLIEQFGSRPRRAGFFKRILRRLGLMDRVRSRK